MLKTLIAEARVIIDEADMTRSGVPKKARQDAFFAKMKQPTGDRGNASQSKRITAARSKIRSTAPRDELADREKHEKEKLAPMRARGIKKVIGGKPAYAASFIKKR